MLEEAELTDAGILASVMMMPPPRVQPRDDFDLTGRELQILGLLAHGLTAAAIGRYLRISDRTVRKHLENGYCKLHGNDRLVAVDRDRARAAGLLPKLPIGSPASARRNDRGDPGRAHGRKNPPIRPSSRDSDGVSPKITALTRVLRRPPDGSGYLCASS